MRNLRLPLLFLAALIIPACGGKKSTIINNITNLGPGGTIVSPFPISGTSGAGTTGFDESGGVGGLGSDGQPRSVYVSSDGTNLQVRFARRNADGTWTAFLPISGNNPNFKDKVTVYVTQNNNFTHIFWLEGATVAVYQLHYAQVNNDPTPVLTVGDTVISTGPTTNVGGGASYGRVTTFTMAIDHTLNNIYAMWVQKILDGGSTDTDVPLVGAVIAGAGLFSERFALISPTGAATNNAADSPLMKVAASGRVHAAWVTRTGVNLAFHRLRTAVNTWSGAAGDRISDLAGYTTIKAFDFALASDGDAYAAWTDDSSNVRAAYRPAGDASLFAADVTAASPGVFSKLIAVLEPGTERFHIVVGISDAAGPGHVHTVRNSAANLGGAWENEQLINAASSTPKPVDFFAWADSTNHVAVVIQSAPILNDIPHILAATRASGTGNGLYTPFKDLTAAGALPCSNLIVVTDINGNAIIAWEQGQDHIVPLGEIFGSLYSSGGVFGGTFNLSNTPALGSHGPIFALLTDAGPGYVSWLEAVTSGPDTHDVYFALKP